MIPPDSSRLPDNSSNFCSNNTKSICFSNRSSEAWVPSNEDGRVGMSETGAERGPAAAFPVALQPFPSSVTCGRGSALFLPRLCRPWLISYQIRVHQDSDESLGM
uniref:SRY-box transcription factor 5 n=1 Tax=Molossus molossus TaxID=27622 RepID=A0A7J8G2H5_MOLMO|nr:SRY-box transcription factor 5 [Molossus molossus]